MDRAQKQRLLLSYLLADGEAFAACQNVLRPEYFDLDLQKSVEYIIAHAEKYRSPPNQAMLSAETGLHLELPDDAPARRRWVCDEVERHCREAAVILAVVAASEKIQSGETDIVEPIKRAVLLSLNRDLGTYYFDDPAARLRKMLDNDTVPTGYKHLDEALYGGVMRGGVNIFMGVSGGGKSLMLANLAVNHMLDKKDVLYLTLELPEAWVAKRIDSMLTGVASTAVFSRIDDVAALVSRRSKDCGGLWIKYMPPGTTSTDVEAYIKNMELQTGKAPEVLCIDYLDLMGTRQKVDMNNISLKDRLATEELRTVCMERSIICHTASQMVRGAGQESDQNQDMIAGGKTKVNTADNVIGIYQPLEMRESGYIQLQLVKTRTSHGTGRRIMLRYNQDTVRFTDGPDELNQRSVSKPKLPAAAPQRAAPSSNMQRILDLKKRVDG